MDDKNELLNALMQELDNGILLVDEHRRILADNPAAQRLLGSRKGQLTGRSLVEATLSYDILNLLSETKRTGETREIEVRRDETTGRILHVKIVPLNAQVSEFLMILQDVTRLRHLETVRSDFVANVSHELNTPLTSIKAIAETLQDGAMQDPDVADRFVNIILSEVDRLTRILSDLLTLSSAESQPPAKTLFDLCELILHALERYQLHAEKTGIILTSQLPLSLPITAAQDQIEQVLVNLVDNGIKYSMTGGKVEVRATIRNEMAVLEVEDNGFGILSQDLPRIWERFYRADKARSRQSGGTGLGLSIVKHIVESHNGIVEVKSEYGRGSLFTVKIPV